MNRAAIYRRQAEEFDRLGDVASGYGGPGKDVDGHRVANECWAMASYLKRMAERAENERGAATPGDEV